MKLVRRYPLLPMAIDRDLRDMERIFDRFFTTSETGSAVRGWKPTVDIVRREGNLVVTADLPGIDPAKDLEVAVEDGVLRISGMREATREEHDEDRFVSERCFGSFERQITLPEGVDPEAISADYESGVLTVILPIPAEEEPKARTIPVRTTMTAEEVETTPEAN
jgi:HSP20 family protein